MEHIVEPYRTTLLDILRKNLKAANRNTYVLRIIYVSSHTFPNYRKTHDAFQKCINKISDGYTDEKITGLLLFYPEYLCHIVETSALNMRLLLLAFFTDEEIRRSVIKSRLLGVYHNINQRFLEEWMFYYDKPPTLLEKIDIDVDRQTTTRHIYNCIKKLYGLMMKLRHTDEDPANASFLMDTSRATPVSFQSPARLRLSDYLPEYSLLDFLLKTEYTEDLESYRKVFYVPELEEYRNMIWPSTRSYVPFYVFESFEDPIEDLPPRESIKLKEVEAPGARKNETE